MTQNQTDGLRPLGFTILSAIRKLLEGTLVGVLKGSQQANHPWSGSNFHFLG